MDDDLRSVFWTYPDIQLGNLDKQVDIIAQCGKVFTLSVRKLIGRSDYFLHLLTAGMIESLTSRIYFPQFSADVLENVLHFMEHGKLQHNKALDYFDILQCVDYLSVSGLTATCLDNILNSELTIENWCELLWWFDHHKISFGHHHIASDKVKVFVRDNFDEILEQSWEDILVIEYMIELWTREEFLLFQYLAAWLEDKDPELQNGLMRRVRFGLMTSDELERVKVTPIYAHSQENWKANVLRAEDYCSLEPKPSKVVFYNDDQNKMRGHKETLVAINETVARHQRKCTVNQPKQGKEHYLKYELDGFGMLHAHPANGFLVMWYNFEWCVFDPRTQTFFELSNQIIDGRLHYRKQFGIIYHDGSLYLFGGLKKSGILDELYGWTFLTSQSEPELTDSVMRYDFETDRWSTLTNLNMKSALQDPCVCTLGDHFYVAGGHMDHDDNMTMDRYCIKTGFGESLGDLPINILENSTKMGYSHINFQTFDTERIAVLDESLQVWLYKVDLKQWQCVHIAFVKSPCYELQSFRVTDKAMYFHVGGWNHSECHIVYLKDLISRHVVPLPESVKRVHVL